MADNFNMSLNGLYLKMTDARIRPLLTLYGDYENSLSDYLGFFEFPRQSVQTPIEIDKILIAKVAFSTDIWRLRIRNSKNPG